MVIRRFEIDDAQQTFEMIAHTLRTVNIRDYSPQFIEEVNMSTYGAKMPRASWNYISNMVEKIVK